MIICQKKQSMSIIKPNLLLIKKVQSELHEIANITLAKEFDKDVVIDKINSLIKDLAELNAIQKEALEEYRKKNKELFIHMEQQVAETAKIAATVNKYYEWNKKYLECIKKLTPLTEQFLEEGKNYENIIEEASKNPIPLNQTLIREVLGTYLQIKFTRKRKRSIWVSHQIFRLNIFYRSILNIMISSALGYIIEKVVNVFFEIPDFYISICIAIFFFYTLEKFLGEKFSSFFWRLIQKQSLILYLELNLYLQQIKLGK